MLTESDGRAAEWDARGTANVGDAANINQFWRQWHRPGEAPIEKHLGARAA